MGHQIHLPVMLDEALQGLAIQSEEIYLDCTFGRGGHSKAILDLLCGNGQLLAIDKDSEAVNSSAAKTLAKDSKFEIVQESYACLQRITDDRGWSGKVAGIILDLGVSSPQLDSADRGFSFIHSGPLDMRMDAQEGLSAADWLANVTASDLTEILKTYGEERFARRIANTIVTKREQTPIVNTRQLADIIADAIPFREKHKHPATRSFQAIRIYINHELVELESGLKQAVNVLKKGGRLVVISFHSLEDRIVKRFFRDEQRGGNFPKNLPVTADAYRPRLTNIGKAIQPSPIEVGRNPRARSAIMRVAERI